MKTDSFGNPALSGDILLSEGSGYAGKVMTRSGVATWLVIHLVILLATAAFTWHEAFKAFGDFDFKTLQRVESGEVDSKGKAIMKTVVIDPLSGKQMPPPEFNLGKVKKLMLLGLFGGFILAMVGIFAKQTTPVVGPLYAAFEGLALGGVSAFFELEFQGISMQAFALTVAVFVSMLGLYITGILRPTRAFVAGVLACMIAILLIYVGDMLLRMFGGPGLSIVHSNGALGIAFSLFVCVIAAFNLTIDFHAIEEGIESRAPAYMNAYSAFAMMITLVWLYLEILRLLAKLRSRK